MVRVAVFLAMVLVLPWSARAETAEARMEACVQACSNTWTDCVSQCPPTDDACMGVCDSARESCAKPCVDAAATEIERYHSEPPAPHEPPDPE